MHVDQKNSGCSVEPLHEVPLKLLDHSPIVVPSSPIMHFIEVMICSTTGGDMEVA